MGIKTNVAYKVVEKGTRHGSNWAIYKQRHMTLFMKSFRKKYIHFFPRYLKGTIVKAMKSSVGIFIFPKLEDAQNFEEMLIRQDGVSTKIIKVQGLGERRKIERIILGCGTNPRLIINQNNFIFTDMCKGIYSYPAVKVLE